MRTGLALATSSPEETRAVGRSVATFLGPRDVVSLWGNGTGSFVDRRMVNVRGSRVARVRPIFPVWSAEFDVLIDPAVINPMEFRDIVEKAGRMIGVGDYRRFYGKFKGEVIE